MTDAPASPTDEELIRRAGEGDAAAFGTLASRHAPALLRFARRLSLGHADADDALQDALIGAWRGARTWRGTGSVRTWLFQVVLNACRRRVASGLAHPSDGDDHADRLPSTEAPADARASARELGAALDAALAALPPEAREVLILRDVEGLSGDETAAALGLALPAMKSRLHRARLDLKATLEARLGHAVTEELP